MLTHLQKAFLKGYKPVSKNLVVIHPYPYRKRIDKQAHGLLYTRNIRRPTRDCRSEYHVIFITVALQQ